MLARGMHMRCLAGWRLPVVDLGMLQRPQISLLQDPHSPLFDRSSKKKQRIEMRYYIYCIKQIQPSRQDICHNQKTVGDGR